MRIATLINDYINTNSSRLAIACISFKFVHYDKNNRVVDRDEIWFGSVLLAEATADRVGFTSELANTRIARHGIVQKTLDASDPTFFECLDKILVDIGVLRRN